MCDDLAIREGKKGSHVRQLITHRSISMVALFHSRHNRGHPRRTSLSSRPDGGQPPLILVKTSEIRTL